MNIHAKLRLLMIVSIGVILVVAGTLVITTSQNNQAVRENEIANDINRQLLELGLLTTDYVLHDGARAEQQWHSKQDQLVMLVALANFARPADQIIADRIRRSAIDMHVTFVGLNKLAHEPQVNAAIAAELKRRYVGQIGARAQAIASAAAQLARSSADRIQVIRQRRVLIFVFSVVLVAGYMIGTALAFDRGIVRPLHTLHKGTEVIGSGRLDYKVGLPVQNEIGQLSRAFDDMTSRLQQITVSRDELAAEIEQRKHVEAELARSNKELEVFAYVASHDLQEPLRAVAGFVDLFRHRYAGKFDSRADEYLTFIVDGAKRMQILISGLLEYSRVTTTHTTFAVVDSAAALQGALTSLRTAIEETRATVTQTALPTIWGDAAQVMRLLQNLIGNALKFHGTQPPQIHISAERTAAEWRFAVRDNGIGIEPQYFERIFVIFQRLHTQAHYPGTGLGLAICKRIVERHGGRIWVESVPDNGATFYFTLPAQPQGDHQS